MEIANVIKLIETVSLSNLTEFSYKEGSTKLTFSKNQGRSVLSSEMSEKNTGISMFTPVSTIEQEKLQKPETQMTGEETEGVRRHEVDSPLVGTFYSAPSPDAPAFVKVGDRVKKGQILGIVEAMKLMNEIESEYDGVVQKILVENEDVVEYGQPLFFIQ